MTMNNEDNVLCKLRNVLNIMITTCIIKCSILKYLLMNSKSYISSSILT